MAIGQPDNITPGSNDRPASSAWSTAEIATQLRTLPPWDVQTNLASPTAAVSFLAIFGWTGHLGLVGGAGGGVRT